MSDGLVEKNQHEVMLRRHVVVIWVWYLRFHCHHFSFGTVQRVASNDNVVCVSLCTMTIVRGEKKQMDNHEMRIGKGRQFGRITLNSLCTKHHVRTDHAATTEVSKRGRRERYRIGLFPGGLIAADYMGLGVILASAKEFGSRRR